MGGGNGQATPAHRADWTVTGELQEGHGGMRSVSGHVRIGAVVEGLTYYLT